MSRPLRVGGAEGEIISLVRGHFDIALLGQYPGMPAQLDWAG